MTVTTDKDRYDPGETATLVIQSPFQTARALAVVEEPEGRFRYDWVDIANGFGRYAVPIRKAQMPQLAVHFLVMRGRLAVPVSATAPFDQGKPTTLAATKWVTVNPTDNRVNVSFDAPAEARPAQEFDLVLHLADARGRPLAGEATVWMVDQAVLSLAKEAPLDPLPAFIVDRPSTMAARDTRNMAFGVIPLQETPGGDENGDFGMENISVRKNFTPVPLYVPRVKVRGGRHRPRARQAAGHADRVHAAGRGGQRPRPVRLRHRADAGAPADGGAAGPAPLRPPRRQLQRRADRPRGGGPGRRRAGGDLGRQPGRDRRQAGCP